MIIKSPNVEPPKDVEDVEQTSYHDKNLMVSVDKSNDQVWINTHGTFWKGSFADLLEFCSLVQYYAKQRRVVGAIILATDPGVGGATVARMEGGDFKAWSWGGKLSSLALLSS